MNIAAALEGETMVEGAMPQVGDTAPGVEAQTATGEHFSLTANKGRWVVLYFYPRANTPG